VLMCGLQKTNTYSTKKGDRNGTSIFRRTGHSQENNRFLYQAGDGTIVAEGKIEATRKALQQWVETIPGPWIGAMEATLFTGWVYDFLKPYARQL